MPTGYTADIQDGSVTELRPFIMCCARAFSALAEMRDEPLDATIPAALKADTSYYDEVLAEAIARKDKLLALDYGARNAAAERSYQEAKRSYEQQVAARNQERQRYEAMMEKVKAWSPPESCEKLKAFAIQQLEESLKFDCNADYDTPPTRVSADDHLKEALRSVEWEIQYYSSKRVKAIQAVAENNHWLDALRASLV